MSDSEYDAAVMLLLSSYNKRRALEKLSLDEEEIKEAQPISLGGYSFRDASLTKKGADGVSRSNKYSSIWIFFTEQEIHCYKAVFCTTEPLVSEATDVWFYRDIVSVSTETDNYNEIYYELFKITSTGGANLSVPLRDSGNAQQSINSMRSLIKLKKQSMM